MRERDQPFPDQGCNTDTLVTVSKDDELLKCVASIQDFTFTNSGSPLSDYLGNELSQALLVCGLPPYIQRVECHELSRPV